MSMDQLSATPEKYLPHRGSMLFEQQLLQGDAESGKTRYRIPAQSIFLDQKGQLLPAALVELAAQSFAFVQGFFGEEGVTRGVLAEVSAFRCVGCGLTPGEELLICTEKKFELLPFIVVDFRIERVDAPGATFASGTLKIFVEVWQSEEGASK